MSIFGGVYHNSYFFVDLVKSARAGCFALPMFQRGIVWGESDVLMLLDSIWRGYPIGYLLLWGDMWRAHAQEVRPFQGCNEPVPHAAIVLDGQQRIQAMLDATVPGSGYAYSLTEDRFVRHPDPQVKNRLVPCHMLVDWIAFMHGMDVLWQEFDPLPAAPTPPHKGKRKEPAAPPPPPPPDTPERIAMREQIRCSEEAISSFKDARIGTIQIAREKDIAFAREVFRRLNTAGKPFTEDEVFACLK